ncbi:MAG: hypothetical protein V2A79_09760 [Planctomycetota bacterium]
MAGVYDPKLIELIPGVPEFLRWCRNRCGSDEVLRDSLFCYRHGRTGVFMLARWLCYRSVFLPILEIGPGFPNVGPETCAKFLSYLHPDPETTAGAALREAAYNARHEAENFDAKRKENRAKLLRDELGIKLRRPDGGVFAPTAVLDA